MTHADLSAPRWQPYSLPSLPLLHVIMRARQGEWPLEPHISHATCRTIRPCSVASRNSNIYDQSFSILNHLSREYRVTNPLKTQLEMQMLSTLSNSMLLMVVNEIWYGFIGNAVGTSLFNRDSRGCRGYLIHGVCSVKCLRLLVEY